MLKFASLLLAPLLWAAPIPVENAYVKVIDALDTPHKKGAMHEHKVNRVMVYLDACQIRITDAGGQVEDQKWQPGQVAWSPARGPHTSENITDKSCRIIEIELKPDAGWKPVAAGPLDPVKVDPKHYKVLIDNPQVRVLRARYGAHETGAMHEHLRDRVTVFLTPMNVKVTNPDGKVDTLVRKAGDAGWGGVSKHQEENLADGPFEVIAVELRNR
jgi:hypothetical protein